MHYPYRKPHASRTSPERSVQVTLVKWLRTVLPRGTIVAAIKNEAKPKSDDPGARARFFEKRRREGVVTGIPDLAAWMPNGKTLLVEVKRPDGGIVSTAQEDIHAELRALGHTTVIATSIETCRGALLGAGIPLRESAGQPVAAVKVRAARRQSPLDEPIPF